MAESIHMIDATARDRFEAFLLRDGVRAALVFLNGLTAHRYTAKYQFVPGRLENLYFFDRFDATATTTDDLPVEATYCVYVRDSGRPFIIADALTDVRAANHPKRTEVRAYCGVPLVDDKGVMFGTLCHFDHEPVTPNEGMLDLMESLGPLLAASTPPR